LLTDELKRWIGKVGSEEVLRSLEDSKEKRFSEIAPNIPVSTRAQRLKEARGLRLIDVVPMVEERNFLYRITREGLRLLNSLEGIHELEKVLRQISEG